MDCAVEEGEIRQALEKVTGLRGLKFQLGARTLAIDAPEASVQLALEAIRRAGYRPVPLAESGMDESQPAHGHCGHDGVASENGK